MKPRLVALLVLTCALLMVGLIPAAAAQSAVPTPHIPLIVQKGEPLQDQSDSNDQEIVGWLNLIWGDSAPGAPSNHPLIYTLTDDQFNVYNLVIGANTDVTPSDLLLLNGERVRVTGQNSYTPMGQDEAMSLAIIDVTSEPDGSIAQAVSGNKPWVSLMCKFPDVSDEPRDWQYFQDMYSGIRPGLDHYWREVSYDAINIQGSDAFGWYTLPHPRSYYVDDAAGVTDLHALVIDCTAVANADVYFPDYFGINLMFNEWLGCCAWGGGSYLNLDGVEQEWRVTWEPPWAYSDISVIYHEMGHGFGLPHSSGDYGYVYDNVWDVMSADRFNCTEENADPVYGCLGQNTIAFYHELLEWIPPGQVYLADIGSHSLTLEQIDQPQTNEFLLAKIPVEGSSNRFFTAEARRMVGYDQKLPGEAVIIHEVNLNWSEPAHVVDVDWNEDTADEGAMWRVGETFTDASGEISITVDAATATGFEISIINNSEPPIDPFEPNNSPEQATPVAYGDELTGALIQVPGDADWYVFEASSYDQVSLYIDAASLGSVLEPWVTIYKQTGSGLELFYDGFWGGDGDESFWLEEGGQYYVEIKAYNHGQDGGGEYYYDLALYIESPWEYIWFNAEVDAYVNQGSKTANYGSAPILRVKNASADMNAYLKFWIDMVEPPAGQCLGDTALFLGMFVKEPSTDGGNVYGVNSGWNENTINWNNAPPIGGAALGSFGSVSDENRWYAWLEDYQPSDGYHSFAVRNNSSNSVDYSSSEGQVTPILELDYQFDKVHKPRLRMRSNDWSGLAPMTAQFSSDTAGCPSEWYWDFGDGTTSYEKNPTHTFTEPGWYLVNLTVSNSKGSSTRSQWLYVAEKPDIFYISPSTIATIGGIPSQPADILRYDKGTNGWTMVYDGSNHGTLKNVSAFTFEDDGDLLLSFSASQPIPGLGTVTPRDVVRFSPDMPWVFPLGSGSWSWHLRGNWPNVGLTTSGEAIDAINEQWDDLAVSTTGAAALPTSPVTKAADEDIIWWSSWSSSWSTWLEIDGSNIPGLAGEDINGFWYDTEVYDYYITILGSFNLGGVTGNGKSIVRLTWDNGWRPSLVEWLAPGAVFPSNIDAIELAR